MHFSLAAATALLSVASAAVMQPAPRDDVTAAINVTVTELTARRNPDLESVQFTIEPAGSTCSSTSAEDLVYPRMTTCTGGNYRYYFQIAPATAPTDAYNVTVTYKVGMNSVVNGTFIVPTNCRVGGAGPDDEVCNQTEDVNKVLGPRYGTY